MRTVSKFVRFILEDSGGTLREIPVKRIGAVNLTYPEVDLTAFHDAVKGFLTGEPDFQLEFGGPFDTADAAAISASTVAPVLSGSHTVLYPLLGGVTPLAWGVLFGLQSYWTDTTDPTFIMSSTAVNGVLVTKYDVVVAGEAMEYNAKICLYPASAAPVWAVDLPTVT